MESLTGAQRKYLRGLAHSLRPVVMVGRQGVSPELLKAVDEALDSHELIKIKFVEFKEERKGLAREIAAGTQSELAGLIGNVAILYRRHPQEDRRKITLT